MDEQDVQVRLYRAGFYRSANAIDVAFSKGSEAVIEAFERGRRVLDYDAARSRPA